MDENPCMALGILPGSGKWILWDKMTAMGGHILVETQTSKAKLQFLTFSAKRSDRPKGV